MNQPENCRDCGQPFTLTSSEQDFYVGRNLSLPKRCVACRQARRRGEIPPRAAAPKAVIPRRQVTRVVTEMDEPPAQMRQIICSECGQEAEIPARCKFGSKAKCQKCWKKDVQAWLKRKAARRQQKDDLV